MQFYPPFSSFFSTFGVKAANDINKMFKFSPCNVSFPKSSGAGMCQFFFENIPFHHLLCLSSAFVRISSELVRISSELVQISSELVSINLELLIISVFKKIHYIGLQPACFALKVSKYTFVLFLLT